MARMKKNERIDGRAEGKKSQSDVSQNGVSCRPTESHGMDTQYTGPCPRYSGAISEVTGGSPEDMNEMPAAEDPDSEGPIYDGSQVRHTHSNELSR